MDHINTTEVIGEGVYPDEPRVVAIWNAPHAGPAETPIVINVGPFSGRLKPNVDTLMPEVVATMLVDSGYDVEVKFSAIVNPGIDDEMEAAVQVAEAAAALAASRNKAAELVKLSVAKIEDAVDSADLNTLRFALEAEDVGQKRVSAIKVIEAAIDAHPDQVAALAAAAGEPVTNEKQAS